MTTRQRAGLFVDQHCADLAYERRQKIYYAIWNLLDEVIKTAVEAEREAFLTIICEEIAEEQFNDPFSREGETIRRIVAKIRAPAAPGTDARRAIKNEEAENKEKWIEAYRRRKDAEQSEEGEKE